MIHWTGYIESSEAFIAEQREHGRSAGARRRRRLPDDVLPADAHLDVEQPDAPVAQRLVAGGARRRRRRPRHPRQAVVQRPGTVAETDRLADGPAHHPHGRRVGQSGRHSRRILRLPFQENRQEHQFLQSHHVHDFFLAGIDLKLKEKKKKKETKKS